MASDAVVPDLYELASLEHNCQNFLQLRERKVGAGFSYVYQCLFCGEQKGNALPKRAVSSKPPPFDTERQSCFEARRIALLEKRARVPNIVLSKFDGFLPSATELKTERINAFKEELRSLWDRYSSETSEEHMHTAMREMLNKQRNNLIRQYNPKFGSEDHLSYWFRNYFGRWFYIYQEINGQGFVGREQCNVRIDYVLRPKQELIERGVRDGYLGVEVKFLSPADGKGFHGKSSQSVFQALSYSYAGTQWFVPGESQGVTLDAVLLFSNLSFESDARQIYNSYDHHFEKVWRSYLRLANHAGVGEIKVSDCGWRGTISRWDFQFAGSHYLSWIKQKDGIVLGNQNTVCKRRVGNIQ